MNSLNFLDECLHILKIQIKNVLIYEDYGKLLHHPLANMNVAENYLKTFAYLCLLFDVEPLFLSIGSVFFTFEEGRGGAEVAVSDCNKEISNRLGSSERTIW